MTAQPVPIINLYVFHRNRRDIRREELMILVLPEHYPYVMKIENIDGNIPGHAINTAVYPPP